MKITVLIFLALLFCNKDNEINTNQNQSNKVESQTEVSVKKETIEEKKEFNLDRYWWGIANKETAWSVLFIFDFTKHHTFLYDPGIDGFAVKNVRYECKDKKCIVWNKKEGNGLHFIFTIIDNDHIRLDYMSIQPVSYTRAINNIKNKKFEWLKPGFVLEGSECDINCIEKFESMIRGANEF